MQRTENAWKTISTYLALNVALEKLSTVYLSDKNHQKTRCNTVQKTTYTNFCQQQIEESKKVNIWTFMKIQFFVDNSKFLKFLEFKFSSADFDSKSFSLLMIFLVFFSHLPRPRIDHFDQKWAGRSCVSKSPNSHEITT